MTDQILIDLCKRYLQNAACIDDRLLKIIHRNRIAKEINEIDYKAYIDSKNPDILKDVPLSGMSIRIRQFLSSIESADEMFIDEEIENYE